MHKHCDEDGGLENSRGPAPFAKWAINGVGEFRTCLLPMITRETEYLLRLHQHYRAGHLPLSGGVLDQPNAYLQAMELLDDNGY